MAGGVSEFVDKMKVMGKSALDNSKEGGKKVIDKAIETKDGMIDLGDKLINKGKDILTGDDVKKGLK